MNITVLTSSYPRYPGDGTAPFVKSLAENISSQGHNVHVVAPYDPKVIADLNVNADIPGGVRVERFRYIWPESYHIMGHAQAMEADVRLRGLSYLLLPFFLVSAFTHLLLATMRNQSDVIHVHWVLPNGPVAMLVSMIRKTPYILSLHGSDVFVARKYKLFGWVAGLVFRHASQITACSQDLMDNAVSLGAPADRVHLIPWGADPDIFKPSRRSDVYLERLGLSEDVFIVSALGRFVYKKGFDRLIKVWKLVSESVPDAYLLIGGDGPIREELIAQTKKSGISESVIFPGAIDWDQVPQFLSSSDLFVLPSIRDDHGNIDGLPTVLLEAMACGTPVIASNLGGIPLVVEDGHNGVLVAPGDVQELSEAILGLINDEKQRRAIGLRARMDILNHHNWANVASIFIDLFRSTLNYEKSASRMGSIYRDEMMLLLGLRETWDSVLDVGCHDGLFLRDLESDFKVGVDPEPFRRFSGIPLIKADGCNLPFADHAFGNIYSLDVIEHVEQDRDYAASLLRVLSSNGRLVITTPSKEIQVFPSFAMGWVNRRWGHHLRTGYSQDELADIFETEGISLKIQEWSAPAYRLLYFPVRALFRLFPGITKNIVRSLAHWDYRHQSGQRGFLILVARRS